MSTAKEALKENLNRYTGQAEALMLVPCGTRHAEVGQTGRGWRASLSWMSPSKWFAALLLLLPLLR